MSTTVTIKGNTYKMERKPAGGRPKKIITEDEAIKLLEERKSMTIKEMAKFHNVTEATMYRYFRIIRETWGGDNNGEE